MSRVATCTNCQKQVTIPENVDEGQPVRCPLCQAECLLGEMLAEATQADDEAETPPELVPVAAVAEEGENDESPGSSEPRAEPSEEAGPALDIWSRQVEDAPKIDLGDGLQIDSETAESVEEEIEEPVAVTAESVEEEVEVEEIAEEPEEPVGETEAPGDETEQPAAEGEERAEEAEQPADETQEPLAETTEAAVETAQAAPEAPSPVAQDEIVRVRCPVCEAEYRLSQVIVASTGEQLGSAGAAAAARAISGAPAAETPALDVWAKAEGVPQIDLGQGSQTQAVAAEAGAFDFARDESEAADAAAGVPGTRLRRTRTQKTGIQTVLGPVLGGIAGLLIAYYLLNWIRGEAGNFLKIPLPGVPHTYKYSPDWFPGWLKPASDSEDAAPGEDPFVEQLQRPALPGPVDERPTQAQARSHAGGSSSSGALAADEAPKRKTFPDGYVGLVEPPSYSSDDLGEALKAARESLADPSEPISEEGYKRLCRLAEVITFVDNARDAKQLEASTSAVRTLLHEIGGLQANLDRIGHRAGALCLGGNRGGGILLAGTVLKTVSEGNAHGAQVQLASSGRTILVASKKPVAANAPDPVLILGHLVHNPAENLVGFTTRQPLVIWAGLTVKLAR